MPVDHSTLPNTMSLSQPRRPPDHPLHDSSSTGLVEQSQTRRQHYGDLHHPQQLLPSSHQPQAPLPPQQPTTQFISKIAQVVLRSRVRPPPAPLGFIDALVLAHHPEFWRNSVPVNIDIYLAASHTLLERWVVSYQPNPATAASPSFGSTASPALSSDQKRKADLTDLILMVQALYSYIRLMPLHALLADGAPLDKADLHYYVSTADGCPLSPSSDAGTSDGMASDVDSVEFDMCASSPLSSSSSSSSLSAAAVPDESLSPAIPPPPPPPAPTPIAFDLAAKLKVYKFRSASTASDGRLHLSVVYDASVAGMVPVSLSAAKVNRSPTKASGPPLLPFGPIAARQRTGSEAKAEGEPMDTDGGGFFERRRSSASLGSPFPSPTMQKRVLTFAHWKLTAAAVPSSPHNVDTAALPPLAPSSPPPALPLPPRANRSNPPLDLAIMIPDSDDGEGEGRPGSNTSSTRSMGIPYGEPMRYRSPGDAGFSFSSSLSTRGTRRPDLRIDIPPSPRFEHEMSEQLPRGAHRRRSLAHHHHHPSHHPHHSHHHHQTHHHHHRHHHNPHYHHHSQADKAPSPTTTIRSIDIPLPALTSGGFSSFSPSSGHHFLHAQRPPNGSYGSHSTTPSDLFGALVGSYEQSILSGRMSALPSKPLRFIAEIGAMAHGRCPPGLRCPPHLAVPFDAFFYEVGEEEAVTPYVGSVNVGEAAANAERKAKEEAATAAANTSATATAEGEDVCVVAAAKAREGGEGFDNSSSKCRDNEQLSRGYRIPPKGQLQIVIKNPSRTAIKLFLLPYDVRDLPPYGKTLLRQKSYASTASTTTQTPAGTTSTSSTTASSTLTGSTATPPPPRILRHAVHVPIHRTKKSVYLGPLVRVVFSSRGADEKERCSVVTEVVGGELNGGGGAEIPSNSRRRGSGITPAR
ncbi:hypothetical protein HDU87_000983 [Geranomyces variabilis]|uniref:Atos-like conserved domain-containing protein n=1 Tax=Geranomyces variabilis TaxID=109894 RepID=A0AAD5TH45_9FUNG|nr:hypothetical protein HDU87_000983 [Geranomyces variabilis]